MLAQKYYTDSFSEILQQIAVSLRSRDIETARDLIKQAVILNIDAPEPHNYLGILYEMTGDEIAARKHYRAAYALDPTYKPACRNLERLAEFKIGFKSRNYDYGEQMQEDTQKRGNKNARKK